MTTSHSNPATHGSPGMGYKFEPKEPTYVGTIGGTGIWAGAGSQMAGRSWTLSFPLADLLSKWGNSYDHAPAVKATPAAQAMLPEKLWSYRDRAVLTIDWPDYGTPLLGRDWWDCLIETIGKLPEGSKVGVYCQGGHGRTGTFLSILLYLAGIVPFGSDPVAYVREHYDKLAVESDSQLNYIEAITGVDVKVRPAARSFENWETGQKASYQGPAKVVYPEKSAAQSAIIFEGADDDGEFEFEAQLGEDVDPEELAVDEAGNTYIYDDKNPGRILVIPAGEVITRKNAIPVEQFNGPWGGPIKDADKDDFAYSIAQELDDQSYVDDLDPALIGH